MAQHGSQSRPGPFVKPVGQPFRAMVERHFDVVTDSGDEFTAYCPWHYNVNTPSLRINVATGMWYCHSAACGAKGGPGSLRRYCGEAKDGEEGNQLAEVRARLAMLTKPHDPEQLLPKPEQYLQRYQFPLKYWSADRGLDQHTIDAFQLGYDPMADHAIIPFRNRHGELLGVIRRDLDPDAKPKYLYPKHFRKSRELFASWFAEQSASSDLVLVEGAIDAMKLWQAGYCAVASYGSRLSSEQIRMIRRMGFTRVTLFFDNDRDGKIATKGAMGQTTQMKYDKLRSVYDPETDLRRDVLLCAVRYRAGWPKDPGAMTPEQITQAVTTARACMNA